MKSINIEGVEFFKSKVIKVEGGDVMHMLKVGMHLPLTLKNQSPYILNDQVSCGEIYFSIAKKGFIKGWKTHYLQSQLFCVPFGNILIGIIDTRPNSSTAGNFFSCELGPDTNYGLLKVPDGLSYAFVSKYVDVSVLCNAPDTPHSPEDNEKVLWKTNDSFKRYEDLFLKELNK